MKSYLIALVDRLLPKIGLVRARLYRGQEAWIGFLESIADEALSQRDYSRITLFQQDGPSTKAAKKARKRAVKG